jgi:hypothetical protein
VAEQAVTETRRRAPKRNRPTTFAEAFKPLVGQLIWNVHRGFGHALLMNFGRPHLIVVEPVPPRPGASREEVQRRRKTRWVWFEGQWSVLADRGRWKITTAKWTVDSEMRVKGRNDRAFRELSGQRLVSVRRGKTRASLLLKFDLGGLLELAPDDEIEIEDSNPWSLISWKGETVIANRDGTLSFEAKGESPPHFRYIPPGQDP